jgi:hypothetical protein
MAAQRGGIAHQQQLAPCAGHAHVHAADVRQEADLEVLNVSIDRAQCLHTMYI